MSSDWFIELVGMVTWLLPRFTLARAYSMFDVWVDNFIQIIVFYSDFIVIGSFGAFAHGCSRNARSVYCRDFSNKINLWIPKIVTCPPTPPLSQHFAVSEK